MMRISRLCASLSLLHASLTAAQSIQLFKFTAEDTGLSSTCVAVLNQAVTCDSSLEWAGRGRYESDEILKALCTSTCAASLKTWLGRASGACTMRYIDPQGNAILPAYWVEAVFENYNLLCQTNGNSFCNAVIRDLAGIDPENQSQTKTPVSTVTCDDCFLKQMQTRLQMPLQSNTDIARTFTSLTSACKKSGFAVTPIATTTNWITSATAPASSGGATPTPTGCTGSQYTVRSGDTCQSIAAARGISVAGLLTANGLQSYCANFPTSGTLCIPASERCKVYAPKANDTCTKIADANKLAWVQVVTWNPVLSADCGNIANYTGYPICISTPGGDWVNPSPVSSIPESTSSFTSIGIGTAVSLLPTPTNVASPINGSDNWVYKFAQGTRLDCTMYANGTDFGPSASCEYVAKAAGVNASEIADWNPSLKNSSCVLDGKLTYCVQQHKQNFTASMTEYCNYQDVADFNATCLSFLSIWGINSRMLNDFNPGVGKDCENWKAGRNYCVMARHFRQPGIVSSCNKFMMANESSWNLDPCGQIEAANGLQHARFVAWNPAVQSNCTGIGYHYDYCVSIPGFKPTYTSYVFPIPTRAASVKALDVGATGSAFAMTDASSPSSIGTTGTVNRVASNTALASASASAIQAHMHKHKRASHQH